MTGSYIVEGLPCSGKNTTAAFAARVLEEFGQKTAFADVRTGNHLADRGFHAPASAGSVEEGIE